jgi:hypothetical protein
MKSMQYTHICLILFATVSPNCSAAQFIQSHYQYLSAFDDDKFHLSKKFISGGRLKATPIVAKHLRQFKGDISDSGNHPIHSYKEDADSHTVVESLAGKWMFRLKDVPHSQKYVDIVFEISHEYNIDPLLLHAIAEVESQFNPQAISPAGAKGLMQIMPSTARRFGMSNPDTRLFNPRDNLRICSSYLRSLHGLFGNNIPLILAAYNAGEQAVMKYGNTIPPYSETQKYVTKVMKRYLELKDLTYDL